VVRTQEGLKLMESTSLLMSFKVYAWSHHLCRLAWISVLTLNCNMIKDKHIFSLQTRLYGVSSVPVTRIEHFYWIVILSDGRSWLGARIWNVRGERIEFQVEKAYLCLGSDALLLDGCDYFDYFVLFSLLHRACCRVTQLLHQPLHIYKIYKIYTLKR